MIVKKGRGVSAIGAPPADDIPCCAAVEASTCVSCPGSAQLHCHSQLALRQVAWAETSSSRNVFMMRVGLGAWRTIAEYWQS